VYLWYRLMYDLFTYTEQLTVFSFLHYRYICILHTWRNCQLSHDNISSLSPITTHTRSACQHSWPECWNVHRLPAVADLESGQGVRPPPPPLLPEIYHVKLVKLKFQIQNTLIFSYFWGAHPPPPFKTSGSTTGWGIDIKLRVFVNICFRYGKKTCDILQTKRNRMEARNLHSNQVIRCEW
jgi:hypothetical protein